MNKLFAYLLIATAVCLSAVAAEAMPFHPVHAGLTIQVSSGCGLGVHRGPYDGCNVVYGGYYRNYDYGYYDGYNRGYYRGYYDGSGRSRMVNQGACSGADMYRMCNVYGVCWAACY